jgi:hypothetical protein
VSRRPGWAASTELEMPTKNSILRILLVPEDRQHEPTFWKSKPIPPETKARQNPATLVAALMRRPEVRALSRRFRMR